MPKPPIDKKWMALIIVLATAGVVALYIGLQHRRAETCLKHLKQIHAVVGLYEFNRGQLPHLAFYPEDPKEDPESIGVALRKYGSSNRVFLCPSSHKKIRDTGLSYVWNVALNGKSLKDIKDPVWMMVEVNALSDDVPPPHLGRYHILYTDGRVVLSDSPPADIDRLLAER